jgi:integrase
LLVSAGANVKAVQRHLGHATATQTLDRYAHLFTEDLEAVAERLEEVWRLQIASPARPGAVSKITDRNPS